MDQSTSSSKRRRIPARKETRFTAPVVKMHARPAVPLGAILVVMLSEAGEGTPLVPVCSGRGCYSLNSQALDFAFSAPQGLDRAATALLARRRVLNASVALVGRRGFSRFCAFISKPARRARASWPVARLAHIDMKSGSHSRHKPTRANCSGLLQRAPVVVCRDPAQIGDVSRFYRREMDRAGDGRC